MSDKTKKVLIVCGMVLCLLVGTYIGLSISKEAMLKYRSLGPILDMIELIQSRYYRNVNTDTLLSTVARKMLQELDAFSEYIPEETYEYWKTYIQGNFAGIGVELVFTGDTPVVSMVMEGGPSYKAGILPGDHIIKCNDTPLTDGRITHSEVISILRGKPGSSTTLTIIRPFVDTPITVNVVREKVNILSIPFAKVIDSILLLRISLFSEETRNEFDKILEKINLSALKGIIIDIRDNSGGVMESVSHIINELFEEGILTFKIVERNGKTTEIITRKNGSLAHLPLIILVNENSASASEILAGSIQENDRGIIIGTPTFGKSLIQQQFYIQGLGSIKLSVGEYMLPSGRIISNDYNPNLKYQNGTTKYKTKIFGRPLPDKAPIIPDIIIEDNVFPSKSISSISSINFLDVSVRIERKLNLLEKKLPPEKILQALDTINLYGLIPSELPQDSITLNLIKMRAGYHLGGYYVYYSYFYRIDPVFTKALNIIKGKEQLSEILKEILQYPMRTQSTRHS